MTACVRAAVRCESSTCRKPAAVLCRYPVTRNGRAGMCNRHICAGHASADGFCPPHARIGTESLVTICSACYSCSCAYGEMPCGKAGKTRRVTTAQWKSLLSFGVL